MAAAAVKKLVMDVAKTVPHFDGQTGWDCKQWLLTMEHTCNNVDLSDDQMLNVFKICLRGVALLWWNNLNEDIKDEWETVREAFLADFVPHVAYQKEMKHIFKTVKQGLHGESVASYARTFLWNINELSTMPNLEDLLTGFKRGLIPAIKSKMPVRVYNTLEDMIEQAKLIEEDYIKSADEDIGFSLVKNVLKYNPRDNYLVGIYEESVNKTKEQTVNAVTAEKLNEKKRAHEETAQQSAELTNCKRKIQQLEEQLALKNTKQTEDKLTEIFQKALAMNSFPFPNRGIQTHREKPQRSERKMTPKARRKLYQQNKAAGIKCSVHRTHGHSDEQCFSQKPTNIHTVEEETAQEEIVTPFKLIGLTDIKGNLLETMKDTGTGPSLVRASAVLNAGAQLEPVSTRTTFKAFGNQRIAPIGTCKFTMVFENRTITVPAYVFPDDKSNYDIIIGNSFSNKRSANINFDGLSYSLLADDGFLINIPGSMGETRFNSSDLQFEVVCT